MRTCSFFFALSFKSRKGRKFEGGGCCLVCGPTCAWRFLPQCGFHRDQNRRVGRVCWQCCCRGGRRSSNVQCQCFLSLDHLWSCHGQLSHSRCGGCCRGRNQLCREP